MKKWWKKVPYKTKAILNLTLIALCALVLWVGFDYPLPTRKMEFYREARENLLGKAEYLDDFHINGMYEEHWDLAVNKASVLMRGVIINEWPRDGESPTLAPVPRIHPVDTGTAAVVAVDAPGDAVSAQLTVKLGCYYSEREGLDLRPGEGRICWRTPEEDPGVRKWNKTFVIEGEPLAQGAYVFPIISEYLSRDVYVYDYLEMSAIPYISEWGLYYKPGNYPGTTVDMEAIFYNANGEEVGKAALSNLT